jgi:hypothetical protein
MRKRRKLHVIEVLDEVLRILPKTKYYVPSIFEIAPYQVTTHDLPDLRRKQRTYAQSRKARRSQANSAKPTGLDVQVCKNQEASN